MIDRSSITRQGQVKGGIVDGMKAYDFYIHDATGNIMAIYSLIEQVNEFKLKEEHIYGSSRLGIYNRNIELTPKNEIFFTRGIKNYELSNHLGNVNTVISDRKRQINVLGSYLADIKSYVDYYPFGYQMAERTWQSDAYRFGFNDQEKDDEIYGEGSSTTEEFWQYDARLGRRWNIDPVEKTWESSYATFANNPIRFRDLLGADTSFANNAARTQFVETYESVNNAIKVLDKKIDDQLAKWEEKGYDNEKVNKRMSHRIKNLNSIRSQLFKIKISFDEVINSETLFHYDAKPNPEGRYTSGSGTFYNKKENRVDIWFFSGLSNSLVHETRHGAGYSWKEWGWDNGTNSVTNYDYQDEYDAYRQESDYSRIVLRQSGMSRREIMSIIEKNYGSKNYIIKEFRQYCEPESPQ